MYMMVPRMPFAHISCIFSFLSYFYVFVPRASVQARGRPENAGGGEGGEASTTVMETDAVSITTASSSSSTTTSSPVASPGPSPSTKPNSASNPPNPSSPSPGVDPNFPIILLPPSNSTTCGNASFSWTLADPSFNNTNKLMNVYATNDDVNQMPFLNDKAGQKKPSSTSFKTDPTPVFDPDGDGDDDGPFPDPNTDSPNLTLNPPLPQSSHIPRIPISLILTNKTAVTSGQLTISVLSVPQGWYVFAVISDFTVPIDLNNGSSISTSNASSSSNSSAHLIIRSTPFFISDNGNTSCIPPALLQIAQQNQNGEIPTLPLSSGALAGTIIGSIVGVIVLIGACLLPRIWRRGFPGHRAWKGKGKLYHAY